MGVLHPVQHHHEGLFALLSGQGQDVGHVAVFDARGVGHDPLVVGGLAAVAEGQTCLVQLLAVHLVDDDPGVLSQGHDLLQRPVGLRLDQDLVDAAARLHGLLHGIAAEDEERELVGVLHLGWCGRGGWFRRPGHPLPAGLVVPVGIAFAAFVGTRLLLPKGTAIALSAVGRAAVTGVSLAALAALVGVFLVSHVHASFPASSLT